jgi:hypothetical protein
MPFTPNRAFDKLIAGAMALATWHISSAVSVPQKSVVPSVLVSSVRLVGS